MTIYLTSNPREMLALVEKYLYKNGYFSIFKENLKLQLVSHPDYPSLKAISDTLDYFKIDNVVVNLPKQNIDELPNSMLALVNFSDDFKIVHVLKKTKYFLLQLDNGDKIKYSKSQFSKEWSGIILAIEPVDGHKKPIETPKIALPLASIIALTILIQAQELAILNLILLFLSFIGIYLSYIIVEEELGIHNKIASKVCGGESTNKGCTDIIRSENSKLLGSISLSDLSLTYFIGSCIIYSLLGFNKSFSTLTLFLIVPVLSYSIFQQIFVIGKWCILCVGIIIILLAVGIITTVNSNNFDFSLTYTLNACFILILIFTTWLYVKPAIISHLELSKTKFEFLRFKRNQNLFKTLLRQRPIKFQNSIKDAHRLSFGAKSPIVTIDVVTNPMCGFCADAFKVYDTILLEFGSEIKFNMIFSVPYQIMDNGATQLAKRMTEIYFSEGRTISWESLREWYNNRNIKIWFDKHGPLKSTSPVTIEALEDHKNWCDANKIDYTPATIIEDCLFPEEYKIEELPLLLTDVILAKRNNMKLELMVNE